MNHACGRQTAGAVAEFFFFFFSLSYPFQFESRVLILRISPSAVAVNVLCRKLQRIYWAKRKKKNILLVCGPEEQRLLHWCFRISLYIIAGQEVAQSSRVSAQPPPLPASRGVILKMNVSAAGSPGCRPDVSLSESQRLLSGKHRRPLPPTPRPPGSVVWISGAAGTCDKESSQSVGLLLGG